MEYKTKPYITIEIPKTKLFLTKEDLDILNENKELTIYEEMEVKLKLRE